MQIATNNTYGERNVDDSDVVVETELRLLVVEVEGALIEEGDFSQIRREAGNLFAKYLPIREDKEKIKYKKQNQKSTFRKSEIKSPSIHVPYSFRY